MIDYWGVSIKAADGRKGAPKNQQYRWVKALGVGKSRECGGCLWRELQGWENIKLVVVVGMGSLRNDEIYLECQSECVCGCVCVYLDDVCEC